MKVHNHWNGQCHENSESIKLSAILGHSEHDCNSAIGGQGQLGCTWAVCHRSSTPSRRWWKTENALYYVPVLYWSELRICVRTKLNDVDTLSEMSLVNSPTCLCRGRDQTGPIINVCDVWLVPMVRTQVRVPAKAPNLGKPEIWGKNHPVHQRTMYKSPPDPMLHASPASYLSLYGKNDEK